MPAPVTDVNKHLETLGLKPEDLNGDAVRVAYKKLWHPDRGNADPEEAKEKFIEINDAYKALVEECKKRNKRRKPRKEGDGASSRRPFWAGSAPSASSSSSSSSGASSSRDSCATDSSAKQTEVPPAKPKETHPAKAAEARSTHTSNSSSAKSTHTSTSHAKPSDNHADRRTGTHKHEARSSAKSRRSGDRDSSHSSPKPERSHTKSSRTSSAAPKSPRPFKTSHLHDSDSDSSSEGGSLHDHKHRHSHRAKGKKASLGEDDYEFIDLGAPLKPILSAKAASSSAKDWIFPLPLSLEDLYFGATHRYRITRTLRSLSPSTAAADADASPRKSTQTLQIDVKVAPGWRTGTRVRVPEAGNQRADGSFQDIVFVVTETPHVRFVRHGDHLVLPVRVPWVDARSRPYPPCDPDDDDSVLGAGDGPGSHRFGFGRWRHQGHGDAHEHGHEEEEDEVYVMGLDGEEYTLPIPRTLVEAADGTRIFGAGMPVRKNGKVVGKGDLVIR
ncbi:DnaJ-domain-containing protein [Ganoderma leucocontextum]|nr:DnaJ-domain-containing protein [Ganoderma leucocontextum]